MRVRLLRTLPSEGRTSSEVYAEELGAALRCLVEDPKEVVHWIPPDGRGGYLRRYVGYQWAIRGGDGAINHIVDHGYGHLGFSLDPRRTLVTFHDAILLKLASGELPGAPRPWRTILGHRLSLWAIRGMARVITDSESSRQDFLRFVGFDPDRVITVPLGVSPRFRPDSNPDSHEVATRPLRILHVGHTGFYKNIEGIIGALPVVTRLVGRPVVFLKVGTPFTAAQRQLIGQLGIDSQVRHLGVVPAADLPAVYREADVLVMPSWHEGFGLPALEAMACGIPVVVSDRGSLPEVVGAAALIVNAHDDAQLVYAVVRALTDGPLRQDLRQRGLERARMFTWEQTARETLAVYRAVSQEVGR